MRLPAPLAIIPALLLCTAGFCQRATSQTKSPEKKPAAAISGKVTIKGKPAPGVVVGVRSSRPAQSDPTFKATTDQDGKYRIDEVPAGSYEVAPVTPALVISEVNNSTGRTVIITEGEHVEGIDFGLVRGGVITGKITDADGHPIIEERVNLMPIEQGNPGRPVYPMQINFQTDDRGIYRLFGIRPGRYKVSIGDNYHGLVDRGRPGYPTTFYPDATEPAKATVVEIDEGTEATGIDITLARHTELGFSVSGRVVDESGKAVSNVRIGLSRIVIVDANHTESYSGGRGARSDSQGEFRFEKLPPGKYSVSIEQTQESDLLAGPVAFDVLDQDVTGLLIRGSIQASLSGVVVLEGARDKSTLAALTEAWISLTVNNEALHSSSSQLARMKPDGSFRIAGLQPGIARLSIDTPGAKWFTTSRIERDGVVQLNGIQIRNAEQVTGIRVVVAYSNGSIRGVVKMENGTLPSSGRLFIQLTKPGDQSGNMPQVEVDSRGHFLIEGLAAGNYELKVSAYVPEWRRRPPFAKQIVTVTDGAATDVTVTIDLTATPNP